MGGKVAYGVVSPGTEPGDGGTLTTPTTPIKDPIMCDRCNKPAATCEHANLSPWVRRALANKLPPKRL